MPQLDIEILILVWSGLCALGLVGICVWAGVRSRGTPLAGVPQRRMPEGVRSAAAERLPEPPDLRSGLRKTRLALVARLDRLLRSRAELDAAVLDEIEEVLFGADLGVRTAEDLLETVRRAASPSEVHAALERRALEILDGLAVAAPAPGPRPCPHVVLVVGVNGSGKTTSVGKLAARWTRDGRRVLMVAADTFRAAAVDQLEIWAERAGAEIVKGSPGGDPAAVAFDAVQVAKARGIDVVLIDTAGRLHTQAGLMDELGKISRAVKKEIPGAPHEVVLVLDANTGQNAIRQAEEFARCVEVTHILLAKLDGSAKGGVVLGIARELGLPVRYVGVGERIQDLRDFEAGPFVRALFELSEEDTDPVAVPRQAGSVESPAA